MKYKVTHEAIVEAATELEAIRLYEKIWQEGGFDCSLSNVEKATAQDIEELE